MADAASAWRPVDDGAASAWKPVTEEPKSALSRFVDPINPMHLVHALFKPSEDPNEDPRATFGKNALEVLKGLADRHADQFKQAKEAFDKGDYKSAVGHGIYGIAPIIGPMGDEAARKFESGDTAGGIGTLTAILGPKALSEAGPAFRAAGDAAKAAGGAVRNAATSPTLIKALEKSGDAAVVGGIVHGSPGVVAGGVASRLAGGLLRRIGPTPEAPPAFPRTSPPEAIPAQAAPVDQLHAAFEQARAAAPAPVLPEPVAAPSSPQAAPPVQATPTPAPPAAEPVNLGASAPNLVPRETPAAPVKPVPKTTVTARKLATKLQDWDFTPDEGQAMNEQGWAKLAHQAGVELPTKAMRGNAIFELKKALAGNKTPGELIQTLKDSLAKSQAAKAQ